MSENRKIALVAVGVIEGQNVAPHYRYSVWENHIVPPTQHHAAQGKIENVVLRYCDDLIMDVVERMDIKFGIRQLKVKSMPVQMEDERFVLPLYVQIDAQRDLQIIPLGEHGDYDCYALMLDEPGNTSYYFTISRVPNYGRSTLASSPAGVRATIEGCRQDATDPLSTCGRIPTSELLSLFTFIDSKVEPLMQEPIQRRIELRTKSKE